MSRGQNTIKRSEVSTAPILLKYSASYDSSSFSVNGITVNRAINSSYSANNVQFLNYALVKQLYYQEFVTGSMLFSSSYWNPSIQSTAASGTFDNDYRYFPTSSSAQLTVIGIPRTAFGEQIARKSLCITGSAYKLIDDGNGNVKDANSSYLHVGNILYSQGVIIITNEDYQNAMIPVPGTTTTTTSTTSTTTTAVPTTTSTTTSTTTATPTTSTTSTTTTIPGTTTTTTTTLAPTTSTTTTTTIAPTTSTTTTTTIAPTTTTSTTSTTTTSGPTLFVYARYINTNGSLEYAINANPTVTIGALAPNCTFMTEITGLTVGDTVTFTDTNTNVIAAEEGFNAGCATTGYGCSYPIIITSGPNYIYITINGSQQC